jgi:alanine racemase
MIGTIAEPIIRSATRPTWAEVSLARLRQNFRTVQHHVGGEVHVCAVVKAHAYGHGSLECARALESEGAKWFGVTSLDEAIPLREAGIKGRMLLMTGFWRGEEEEVIRRHLTPIIWELWQVELMEKAASALGLPRQPVHLKVDTGMGRLGVAISDLPAICAALGSAQHLKLEGLSTHLASSEVLDSDSVERQLKIFEQARSLVRSGGLSPEFVHVANTGSIIARRETWSNMIRPGIALYGYHLPFQRAAKEINENGAHLPIVPILTWKTRILSIRDMGANQPVGYGGTYVTKSSARIAVLPVGYADGLNRQLSSRGRVIVRGHYAPIVGRISMDLTLADVTGIDSIAVGDEVILLGSSGDLSVDACEHARLANTVPYEILCNISKRVPRRYS